MFKFFVEKLVNGDFIPVGCADSFGNAILILGRSAGRISTKNKEFLIVA